MPADVFDVIIVGGGLRGTALALALAERRPDIRFLLVERAATLGGGAIEPFFFDQLSEAGQRAIDGAVVAEWNELYLSLAGISRRICRRSGLIRNEQLHAEAQERLAPASLLLNSKAFMVSARSVTTRHGVLRAKNVVDLTARPLPEGAVRWCDSATFALRAPPLLDLPILADTSVALAAGRHLTQYLPLGANALVVRAVSTGALAPPIGPMLKDAKPGIRRRSAYPLCVPHTGIPQLPADPVLPSHVYDALALVDAVTEWPLDAELDMPALFDGLRARWTAQSEHSECRSGTAHHADEAVQCF